MRKIPRTRNPPVNKNPMMYIRYPAIYLNNKKIKKAAKIDTIAESTKIGQTSLRSNMFLKFIVVCKAGEIS